MIDLLQFADLLIQAKQTVFASLFLCHKIQISAQRNKKKKIEGGGWFKYRIKASVPSFEVRKEKKKKK